MIPLFIFFARLLSCSSRARILKPVVNCLCISTYLSITINQLTAPLRSSTAVRFVTVSKKASYVMVIMVKEKTLERTTRDMSGLKVPLFFNDPALVYIRDISSNIIAMNLLYRRGLLYQSDPPGRQKNQLWPANHNNQ